MSDMKTDEGKIRFTESQLRSISTRPATDRIVIAMAGSGKTTVLVEFYYALLDMENGFKPSEIVAITFTEKAARSMKVKLIENLIDRGKEFQARELYSAPISTIHSFCANIVRENALVLGLDPDWSVLDEIREPIMLEECLRDVMSRWKIEKNESYQLLLKNFAWGADPYSTFSDFYNDFRSRGIDRTSLKPGLPTDEIFKESRKELFKSIEDFLGAIKEKRLSGKITETEEKRNIIAEELRSRLKSINLNDCNMDLANEISLYRSQGKISGKSSDFMKETTDNLKDSIVQFSWKIAYISNHELRKVLVQLINDFEESYRNTKESENLLDYDDLHDKAIELIKSNPHALERVKSRIKALLIDEFQDTNPVQMTLVDLICPEKRFFAVGDPRQSIYGFRHADVGIMLERMTEYQKGKGDVVELQENFRSRPGILDFVTALFENYPIDAQFSDVRFGRIISGRDFKHEGEEHPVELMVSFGENIEEAREIEIKAVARRVAEILDSKMRIEEKNGITHEITPSDIAILFRKHSNIIDFSRALERNGVPNHVASSQGFYHQREIMDLVNYLELLEDPNNALALSEVVRAPFCGIAIESLYRVIKGLKTEKQDSFIRIDEPFWLNENIVLDSDDSKRWHDFKKIYSWIYEESHHKGPSGRLRDIIQSTHYRGAVASGKGGKRRLGNVGKLLDFSDAWEKDFPGDNNGFLSRMKELRFRKAREGETPISTAENSVTLMTIHTAKGLEFPVVFFADASTQARMDFSNILLTPDGNVLARKRAIDDESDKKVKDFYFEMERKRRNDFDKQESLRVLYVVLTRPMEKLILSFSIGPKSRGDFYEFFKEPLQLDSMAQNKIRNLNIGGLVVPVFQSDAMAELPEIRYEMKDEKRREIDIKSEIARIRKGLPSISKLDAYYSVTAFSSWMICPRRMSLRYIAGYGGLEKDIKPLIERSETDIKEGTEDITEARGGYDEFPVLERGTIIHRLLFEIVNDRNGFSTDKFLESIDNSRLSLTIDQLGSLIDSFLKTEIGRSLISSETRYLEKSFLFAIPDFQPLFKAVIDAAWIDNGKWRIVDYKTGKVRKDDNPITRAYDEQIRMYARAIESVFGTKPDNTSVLYIDAGVIKNIDISENTMKENLRLIGDFITTIENDDFPPNKNDECEWCVYRTGCPAFV